MKEREHILNLIKQTLEAVKIQDTPKLRELSNQTIHTASTTQDEDNILVAVVIYSLGKIFERKDYQTLKGWPSFYRITIKSLENSIKDIEKEDYKSFREDFSIISKAINKVSDKLKKYIEEVFQKSKINKASRIYEHGISLGRTASLLGVTLFDLAGYTGQTGISDMSYNKTIDARQRIKMLQDFVEK